MAPRVCSPFFYYKLLMALYSFMKEDGGVRRNYVELAIVVWLAMYINDKG